jgi:hypothetical protein
VLNKKPCQDLIQAGLLRNWGKLKTELCYLFMWNDMREWFWIDGEQGYREALGR